MRIPTDGVEMHARPVVGCQDYVCDDDSSVVSEHLD
jgi:hypothetical protein